MIKIISKLIFVLFAFSFELIAQEEKGIDFTSQNNWESIIKTASLAGKPVFIDLYTTWCGPCKVMDKEVFVNEKVGYFFNKNFINLKLDAEKNEGKLINKKYKVDAYPSFLFVNTKGELFLKHLGSLDVEDFLKMGANALKEFKSPKPIAIWEGEYQNKKTQNPGWFYDYIFKRKSLGLAVKDIIEEYLSILPEDSLTSLAVEKVITYNTVLVNGKAVKLLLNMYAKDPYTNYLTGPYWSLERVLNETIQMASQQNDIELVNTAIAISNKMYDNQYIKKRAADKLMIKYYGYCKDTIMIKKLSKQFAENYLLYTDIDSLKKSDTESFLKAVLFTFSSLDTSSLKKQKKYRDFARLYRSESKNRANDILEVCNLLCNACGANIEDAAVLEEAKNWLKKGSQFYPDENLYEELSNDVKKCLDKTGKK